MQMPAGFSGELQEMRRGTAAGARGRPTSSVPALYGPIRSRPPPIVTGSVPPNLPFLKAMQKISIRRRTHNLRTSTGPAPDRLIVITGLSGSGKSSLAFDTIYAEGSGATSSLSAYARRSCPYDKPDVDHIEGLSPAISIEQKTASHNRVRRSAPLPNLRLPAPAVRPRRHAPLSRHRPTAGPTSANGDQALSLPRAPPRAARPRRAGRKASHQLLADLRPGYVLARIDARSMNSTTRRSSTCGASTYRGGRRPLQGARRHQARLAESFETG